MNTSEILYLGAKAHVAAVGKRDGKVLWKNKLTGGLKMSGSGFATLLVEADRVYAYTYGCLYCLDAATGQELFACEVPGLGTGSGPWPPWASARLRPRRQPMTPLGPPGQVDFAEPAAGLTVKDRNWPRVPG